MNEHEMNQGSEINNGNDEALQGGDLDLGSTPTEEFDPFGDTDFADEPVVETEVKTTEKLNTADKSTSKPNAKKVSVTTETSPIDPLAQAMDAAETKDAEEAQKSLFTKQPIFSYAAASEIVEDTSITFEDLRIEKVADFPELDDGKRVSWTVEYGKVTKAVSDPKGTTIAKMKSDIETSKEFLDALKKSKDKEPECKLKPKVTAQSKGKIPTYKGVFISMDDAVASGKVISLIPARDGKVYEMRKNEMGKFITPSTGSDMLNDIKAGFYPALPPIPHEKLLDVISFFRLMALKGDYEALVNIYWDTEAEDFIIDVPKQTVTKVSVSSEVNPDFDNERYIHYMDIHSHNIMKAFFSATDNRDEKATRVYAVIGRVLDYFPEIKVRISNGGTYLDIEPNVIFEDFEYGSQVPELWCNQLKTMDIPDGDKTDRAYSKLMLGLAGGDKE